MRVETPFLLNVILVSERIDDPDAYPFSLPAVQSLDGLVLSPVTFFIRENGCRSAHR